MFPRFFTVHPYFLTPASLYKYFDPPRLPPRYLCYEPTTSNSPRLPPYDHHTFSALQKMVHPQDPSTKTSPRPDAPNPPSRVHIGLRSPFRSRDKTVQVQKLNEVLHSIQPTIENRKHFQARLLHPGKYCRDCTPTKGEPGTCGKQCALLRPGGNVPLRILHRTQWLDEAEQSINLYEQMVKDVHDIGTNASSRTLKQWEDAVERLRRSCLSTEELNIELGRPSDRLKITEPRISGLTAGWEFEGRWEKGPGVEADSDVAPENC
jgi:hypothetical protein